MEGIQEMREIKFRVWDNKNNIMLQVHNLSSRFSDEDELGFLIFPLMQYTGLEDKNGKEIYEDDVVVLSNTLADGDKKTCKAVMDGWQSLFESLGDGFYCSMGNTAQNFREVIGNAYENPELLK